jgi:hypothetical protein
MEYSVRNVRTFKGREGTGYTATLCCDGKAVAEVTEEANGSYLYFRWKDQTEEPVLKGHVKTLPAVEYPSFAPGERFDVTPDLFVSTLVETYLFEKNLKNRCKKAILFRLKTDDKGIARRFLPGRVVTSYASAVDYIRQKYDGLVEVIYNERFGCGCKAFRE